MRYTLIGITAFGALLMASMAWAGTGVAWVHGTSDYYGGNAMSGYWDYDIVQVGSAGNPYVVINCDHEEYMWSSRAGGCMADQMKSFVQSNGVDDLVVQTHSNGGNVWRWVVSNPTWDADYTPATQNTRWANLIAASSAGTPLADAVIAGNVFESALGWLLGYDNDAVRQQQTSWMDYYNTEWLNGTSGRPSLAESAYTWVGTDVESAIWDPDSYCGGYDQTVGLEFTQEWLASCSDGFIDCTSQKAAGYFWANDYYFTEDGEPLAHNQSRRDCVDFEDALRDDINYIWDW